MPTPRMAPNERVIAERQARGNVSVREITRALDITNQTWSLFEKTGRVTDGVRNAVAAAFDWPLNWPEEVPPMPKPPRLEELRQLQAVVRSHGQQLDELQEAVGNLLGPVLHRLEAIEAWIAAADGREQPGQ